MAAGDVAFGGVGEDATELSVTRVKEVQSALRRLVKVRCGGSGKSMEKVPPSRMNTGRWSEFRVVRVDHSEFIPM